MRDSTVAMESKRGAKSSSRYGGRHRARSRIGNQSSYSSSADQMGPQNNTSGGCGREKGEPEGLSILD
jgi:hypothetical protein